LALEERWGRGVRAKGVKYSPARTEIPHEKKGMAPFGWHELNEKKGGRFVRQ